MRQASDSIKKILHPEEAAKRPSRRTHCARAAHFRNLHRSGGRQKMPVKRMVLQIGMGTDIRGADYTKAAVRALRDALLDHSVSGAESVWLPRRSIAGQV